MTAEDIAFLRDKATEKMACGMLTDIWLLGDTRSAARNAGSWGVTLRVDDLFELLELAETALSSRAKAKEIT